MRGERLPLRLRVASILEEASGGVVLGVDDSLADSLVAVAGEFERGDDAIAEAVRLWAWDVHFSRSLHGLGSSLPRALGNACDVDFSPRCFRGWMRVTKFGV